MPLYRPGLPPVAQPGEKVAAAAVQPTHKPELLPKSAPPLPPVKQPSANPTPQSPSDALAAVHEAAAIGRTVPHGPILPQPGAEAPASEQQASILSQDEQNMAASLDPAELLHLEEMVKLAKSRQPVQTAPGTTTGEPHDTGN